MGKPVRKRYDLKIITQKGSHSQTFNLDKNIKFIKGIMMSADRDDLIFYRGCQRIEINGVEYFPENYESKHLMCGQNVSPHNRFYDMGAIPTGNGVIKVTYQDADSDLGPWEPYRISLYILGELEDEAS